MPAAGVLFGYEAQLGFRLAFDSPGVEHPRSRFLIMYYPFGGKLILPRIFFIFSLLMVSSFWFQAKIRIFIYSVE